MGNEKYLVWLSLGFSWGSSHLGRILREDTAENVYHNRSDLKKHYPYLNDKERGKLSSIPLERAEMILEQCGELGIGVLPIDAPMYPKLLKEIDSPPPVLYYKGLLPDFNNRIAIAMVGTRAANDYYLRVTGNLSFQLAKAGAIVVSGCAVGADRLAHTGALKAGGFTVGVMAVGLDVDYPPQNRDLREEMAKRGLLISELPPGVTVKSDYFHTRNRIISGLCHGTVITQAPLKSGSLLTADHAVEQNRDLFCVPPNDVFDAKCMGSARLIREGAKVVFSVYDILEEYYRAYPDRINAEQILQGGLMIKAEREKEKQPIPTAEKKTVPAEEPAAPVRPEAPKEAPPGLSQNQKVLFDLINSGVHHIDELLTQSGLPSYAVLSGLTEMELLGIITAGSGQQYHLL